MAAIRDEGDAPRAVIHKRILDVAGERPDASMTAIADAVGGASVDLVERVLEEYGDPGDGPEAGNSAGTDAGEAIDAAAELDREPGAPGGDEAVAGDSADDLEPGGGTATPAPAADGGGTTSPTSRDVLDGVTEKQLEVLRLVHEYPDATQRELGERLGLAASTVHNRLSDVEGFDWEGRWEFVRPLFDGATDGGGEVAERETTSALRERVEVLESRVEELAARDSSGGDSSLPPELVHKVAHACLGSDRLDESEELEVLRALMEGRATDGGGR